MCSTILIRRHPSLLNPDRQEIFLSLPDQAATLLEMTPEEFRERLREAVERAGRKRIYGAGISEGGLSKVLSGEVKNPGIFTVKSITDAAGVTLGALLGEQGYEITEQDRERAREIVDFLAGKFALSVPPINMLDSLANVVQFPQHATTEDDFPPPPIPSDEWIFKDTDEPQQLHARLKPIAGDVAAGRPSNPDDDTLIPSAQVLNSIRELRDPRVNVIRVHGHSMHPTLRHGWLVLIDPARSLFQPGKIVMVYLKDEGTTLGQLAKNGDGFKLLKRNENYGGPMEIQLPAGEWYPVGTVTRVVDAPVPEED